MKSIGLGYKVSHCTTTRVCVHDKLLLVPFLCWVCAATVHGKNSRGAACHKLLHSWFGSHGKVESLCSGQQVSSSAPYGLPAHREVQWCKLLAVHSAHACAELGALAHACRQRRRRARRGRRTAVLVPRRLPWQAQAPATAAQLRSAALCCCGWWSAMTSRCALPCERQG